MKMINKKAMVTILLVAVTLGSLSAASLDDAKKTACNYARTSQKNVTFTTAQEGMLDGYQVYDVAFKADSTSWQFAVDKESGDIVKSSFQNDRAPLAGGKQTISQDKAKKIAINEVPGDSSDFCSFTTDVKQVKGNDCWRVSFNDGNRNNYSVYVDMVTGKVARTECI